MATLYTSDLVSPVSNELELLIDRIDIFATRVSLQVDKFSSSDEFVSSLVPAVSYVENCVEDKTRIRVYLSEGQLDAGEKLQVKLESAE